MWLITLRDLQWRRRRYAIGVGAAAVTLALALLLSGVSASFANEVERTSGSFGADRWVVASGSLGPFTGPTAFDEAVAERVRARPGVERADPVAILRATTTTPAERNVQVIGAVPGGLGPASGLAAILSSEDAAVVDRSLGLEVGDRLALNGASFTVAGLTSGRTYFAGVPTVVLPLSAAQRLLLDGRRLATAVVVDGRLERAPPGFHVLGRADVEADLGRPVAHARDTIGLIRVLLWVVSAGIIGSLVYLGALERTAEFAVLKAIGLGTRSLVLGVAAQAALVSAAAVAAALVIERALEPASAMSVEVPALSYVMLPALAVAAGVAASAFALRRALRVDPALAFA